MVTSSNLTLGENVSGLLGLGFPRLSRIAASTENGGLDPIAQYTLLTGL